MVVYFFPIGDSINEIPYRIFKNIITNNQLSCVLFLMGVVTLYIA